MNILALPTMSEAERQERITFDVCCDADPPASSVGLMLRLRERQRFEERMAKKYGRQECH